MSAQTFVIVPLYFLILSLQELSIEQFNQALCAKDPVNCPAFFIIFLKDDKEKQLLKLQQL